jgi:outer membrane protein OmpA-like peptidoglycan-associated protein
MLKLSYILISVFVITFISSCARDSVLPIRKENKILKEDNTLTIKDESLKIKLSNKGQYLFGMLVDKKTEQFVKRIAVNEEYDNNKYELIKVYPEGCYPSFEPNQVTEHKNSIFRSGVFDGVPLDFLPENSVIYKTDFDEDKFLKIAKNAMYAMYNNVKFTVDLNAAKSINEEYATIELLINHKPNLKLEKALFFVNESAMYADLINQEAISIIKRKHIYKLAIPNGKNRIKVNLLSFSGEKATDKAIIESKFVAKPTFHVLAIGVDEFPKWGKNNYLENAVNDANLVKETLRQRSSKLFGDKINFSPYTLDRDKTTKKNIEKLIEKIRNNVKPNDYFLFFVASHGFIENDKYYFAPSDFERITFATNIIKEDQISDYLINIPTIFRIAILDTCHAGKEVEVIKRKIRKLPLGKKEGISVLSAAKSTQKANDKYKGQGLFTYVLVQGLNGLADYNKDSVVDSIEIAQYVKSNVGKISRSETSLAQDAMVLPNPKDNYNRRFEITLLEQKRFKGFQPNVFTPRESELYIDAIQRQDSQMMNGIIRNNTRHRHNRVIQSIDSRDLTVQKLITMLELSGSADIDINFAVGSTNLTTIEVKKLSIIAKALLARELNSKRILLEGHTDATGTDLHNMNLSQRRADGVAKRLTNQFNVTSNRLSPIGFGEMYPVANNDTEAGRKKNRRVSIFVYE